MFNSVLIAGPSYTRFGGTQPLLEICFIDRKLWQEGAMDSDSQFRRKREVTV